MQDSGNDLTWEDLGLLPWPGSPDLQAYVESTINGILAYPEAAHVHITITHADGSKTDYMQGHVPCRTCGDTACEGTHAVTSDLIGGPIGAGIGGSLHGTVFRDAVSKDDPAGLWSLNQFGNKEGEAPASLSQDHTGEYIDGEPRG